MNLRCGAVIVVAFLAGVARPAEAGILPGGMLEPVPPRPLALDAGVGSLSYRSGSIGGGAGAWHVAVGYTLQRYITIEASYLGAAGQANGGGMLLATLVEGNLRVNPLPGRRFCPYAVAGMGWGTFHATAGPDSASTMTVPIGLGTEVRLADHLSSAAA